MNYKKIKANILLLSVKQVISMIFYFIGIFVLIYYYNTIFYNVIIIIILSAVFLIILALAIIMLSKSIDGIKLIFWGKQDD